MSRVAQLDTEFLDGQLYSIFEKKFNSILPQFISSSFPNECDLLLNTLIYHFSTKINSNINSTATYNSSLAGISYSCSKRYLFLINVLSNYIIKKLKLPNITIKFYSILDLINFLLFLSPIRHSTESNSNLPTLKHRLLKVHSTLSNYSDSSSFITNSRYATQQFNNKQLLWSAILELLNTLLLNDNSFIIPWLANYTSTVQDNSKIGGDSSSLVPSCPICHAFPINPYEVDCCTIKYCFVCIHTSRLTNCRSCNSRIHNIKPYY
ncbi:hypothetical protein TBLA_0A05810 [Henningerozyma blattae CBS 6284]|uniref:RING-type domain-containing protein n=1 Tax=Henningerozyma blattae (strain ATCC 34711 / CBS 6284 / DSM 70876 / NBRC 10599 / NRRL Y-10934 / UCD 77-7) TaxID=1071380 RepID=I2GW72_HENB6|nr:hypothetical protein TBLA_0A05810 [Tetrapisispora blattae CBS 6284]CCH58374.1 hypothetical protein TBLA_0A05810 [Tetrapisispora blattae CBS 6284]